MNMKVLTHETWPEYQRRLNAIRPDTKPKWGALPPAGLMAHLRYTMDVSTGKAFLENQSTFFTRNVLKPYALYFCWRWPREIQVPAYLTPAADGLLDLERNRLFRAVEEFLDLADREPGRTFNHIFFGPLTLKTARRFHGLHFRHHFRQFGV